MTKTDSHDQIAQETPTRRTVTLVAGPLVAAAAVLAPTVSMSTAAAVAPTSARSSVGAIVAGNDWLSGHGVAVVRGRQCVELATRLYNEKHWGSLTNIYNTRGGRPYDHGRLQFHRNGSGYVPVPGDVLVEHGGSYQHVAIVNSVKDHTISTLEQNATPSGRHTYHWNGRQATGAYGPRHVGGFIHSNRNR